MVNIWLYFEPLFGLPPGFLVVDVDTAFTDPVLDMRARSDAPFLVDNEQLSDGRFQTTLL